MYALNFFDTTATRNVLRAMLLTAACVLGMLIAYYAAAVVLPVIVAALTAVASFVVTVASAVLSAAAYAVTVALWCAVRCVIVLALIRALPVLWRASVVVWAHRDGLLVVGRGLVLCAVVVSVFVVALVWTPVVLTACCTVLPQTSIATIVLGGAVATVKGM